MEIVPLLFLLIFQSIQIQSIKIKNRFVGFPLNHTFTLGSSEKIPEELITYPIDYELLFLKGINKIKIPIKINGVPNENGIYDGMTGYIQRNEIDTSFTPVRYDTTPFEPGQFILYYLPESTPRILSTTRTPSSEVPVDILGFLANFSTTIWSYILISHILVTVLTILITNSVSENSFVNQFPLMESIKNGSRFTWDIMMLFLDLAPISVSKIVSVNVAWFFIVLSAYYGCHMILLNTLSADLSVTTEGKRIETLDSLMNDPDFSSVEIIITNAGNMETTLNATKNGTLERELYKRILLNPENIWTADMLNDRSIEASLRYQNISTNFFTGKFVAIEDSNTYVPMIRHSGCHSSPKGINMFTFSKDIILPGLQAHIVSWKTDDKIVKLFDYRMKSIIEFGLIEGLFRHFKLTLLHQWNAELLGIGFECEEMLSRTLYEATLLYQDIPKPFDLPFYRKFFLICISIAGVAFFILLLEIFYKMSQSQNRGPEIKHVKLRKRHSV